MKTAELEKCYHCGEDCDEQVIAHDQHSFCCEGCVSVYDILSKSNMCEYYGMNESPGSKNKNFNPVNYTFIDDPETAQKFISFSDDTQTHISFYLPKIHCSSCIWLLENLHRLNPEIIRSRVNFVKKELSVVYTPKLKLSEIAGLLNKLGYPPHLSLNELDSGEKRKSYFDKSYFYKLGIAFFCFGNIMLLSFPEYLGIDAFTEEHYRTLFGYLNFILALPVLFYSAGEFFRSAWNGIKMKSLNMDFPIALGILIMFLRSSYEIFSQTGGGYMDTLASLVFLMLVGRALQNMTYGRISFDRDYKSYFPISVTLCNPEGEKNIPANQIKTGQRLLIRNQELIPADAILFKGEAHIDYSFVTGESVPIHKTLGEIIFAGGRQNGNAIEVEVVKEVSQSYLTKLWNEETFNKENEEQDRLISLSNRVSRYFTVIILLIAAGAALYWMRTDAEKALHAFTSVLIITCPCALALSTPFTLGASIRILGKYYCYLKNTLTIEKLRKIDTIVFDKTGTITCNDKSTVIYQGEPLTETEFTAIKNLVRNSSHPLSKIIYQSIPNESACGISDFAEWSGKGVEGKINGIFYQLGSGKWLNAGFTTPDQTEIYVKCDRKLKGKFIVTNQYREGINEIAQSLSENYDLKILSGDNPAEQKNLEAIFGTETEILFNQSPFDKLNYIKNLQDNGKHVLMIGDGLNDAGALKQSNVGISISEDINNFSPACDGILDARSFRYLPAILKFARTSVRIILASFVISFLYNIVGLWFAVQGNLSPLVAAILMPISSITVILFTTICVNIAGSRAFKKLS